MIFSFWFFDLRVKEPDLQRISCHSMRHTCITLSLLAGNGLQETKELARHADINTTLLYGHNLKLILNPAFESIDEIIEGKTLDNLSDLSRLSPKT